jgi:hypothetical protein
VSTDPTDRPHGDVETLLRDTLGAEARAAVPYASWPQDPWPRVERAYRRGRARRRAGLAALLVAVVATGGVAAGLAADRQSPPQPADTDAPADSWQALDDGRPRGEPVTEAMRADVVRALTAPGQPESSGVRVSDPRTLRFLWNGNLGGRRVALVRATLAPEGRWLPTAAWVGQPAPGEPVQVLRQWSAGPAVASIPYDVGDGRMHLLAVVRRNATVSAGRAKVRADGTVERRWQQPLPVTDGVVDVPVGLSLDYAPLELRVQVPGRATQYTSVAEWDARIATGGVAFPVTDGDVTGAAAAIRGIRDAGLRGDAQRALAELMDAMASDTAHTSPAVLGAWADGRGGSVVVAGAGYPGQGRLLSVRGFGGDDGLRWWYDTTVPHSPVAGLDRPVTWRVAPPSGDGAWHVAGWLLPGAGGWSQPQVTVNGVPRQGEVTVLDGLGFITVGARDVVRVTATYGDGVVLDETLAPGDTEPAPHPLKADLFPPGPDR